MTPLRKLVGAIIGGALGIGITPLLAGLGVDLPDTLDALITTVLAAIGTYVAPPNRPTEPHPPAPTPPPHTP